MLASERRPAGTLHYVSSDLPQPAGTVDRRTLLRLIAGGAVAAGTATLAGGCGTLPPRHGSFRSTELDEQYHDEATICADYRALLQSRPDLTNTLSPLMKNHQRHLSAIASRLSDPAPESTATSTSDVRTISELMDGEEKLRISTTRRCLAITTPDARSRDAAALLGSISASLATNLVVLTTVDSVRSLPPLSNQEQPFTGKADAPVSAFQKVLAAENAAIYAYGVIGAHVAEPDHDQVEAAEQEHRSRRDLVSETLTARGAKPRAAAPAYELPKPVTDQASAIALAAEVEQRVAPFWRAILGILPAHDRKIAIAALSDCAVRATEWRQQQNVTPSPALAFPGM